MANAKTTARLSSPRLKIAILGVGGIGSAFAFQLANGGNHEVTVVARPGSVRLGQLRRDGGIVDAKGERASVTVTDVLDEEIAYDLLVVTMLAHQVDAVLPTLRRSAARCVGFMFNVFDPKRLQDALGAERCAFGMPFVQAALDPDGLLDARIGVGGQKTKISRQDWVDVFAAAGLPATLEPEMLLWLRCHVPLCVAFESASVAAVRRGGGASWGESLRIARGMREGLALIRDLGDPLYPPSKARLARNPAWAGASMLWTLSRVPSFRDLLASGEGECRELVETMVRAASGANDPLRIERIRAMSPL